MNTTHPRILYLEESPDTLILQLVPSPGLHLLNYFKMTICKCLA